MTARVSSADLVADTIFQLLGQRADGASICPSEVARTLDAHHWRSLMELVHTVAAQLAIANMLRITQGPATVDPQAVLEKTVRGPLRLRRP